MTDERAGDDDPHHRFSQAFWDERYAVRGEAWTATVNRHLPAVAAELDPGRALDVGCGDGADAIWLAQHGWQVTAVDVSPVALARGARQAATVGGDVADRIDWREVDALQWGPPPVAFDLIVTVFIHFPPADRDALIRRLAAGVAPGGTLMVVGHHPSDLQTTVRRPPQPELLYTASQVAALLDPAPSRSSSTPPPNARCRTPAGRRSRSTTPCCGHGGVADRDRLQGHGPWSIRAALRAQPARGRGRGTKSRRTAEAFAVRGARVARHRLRGVCVSS